MILSLVTSLIYIIWKSHWLISSHMWCVCSGVNEAKWRAECRWPPTCWRRPSADAAAEWRAADMWSRGSRCDCLAVKTCEPTRWSHCKWAWLRHVVCLAMCECAEDKGTTTQRRPRGGGEEASGTTCRVQPSVCKRAATVRITWKLQLLPPFWAENSSLIEEKEAHTLFSRAVSFYLQLNFSKGFVLACLCILCYSFTISHTLLISF